jgi:choline dehydrogenase-like flavoprotein
MEGLRVVDASIMPTVVSANTYLTVLALADEFTQRLLRERDTLATAYEGRA